MSYVHPSFRGTERRFQMRKKAAKRNAAYRKKVKANPGYYRTTGYYGRYPSAGGSGTGELKFFDTTDTFAALVPAGEIKNSLNLIPQGVTESTRIGRKCTIRSLQIRGNLNLPPVAGVSAAGGSVVRIIVYQDKQANGVAATVTDILNTADIHSFRNLANSHRFRILKDSTIDINPTAAAGDGTTNDTTSVYKSWECYLRVNVPLEFSSTTGAITELRSNNLGILAISETSSNIIFNYNCRVRYSDM